MKNELRTILAASSLLLVSACGGGNGDAFFGGGSTEVREISVDDDVISLGGGTVIRVDFSFNENDVFSDDGNVRLVVKLADGLEIRSGSSEIDGRGGDDDKIGAQVLECPNGESFLLFDMDQFDLDNAAPPDDADAELKLTVDGTKRGEALTVEAAADDARISYSCNDPFIADERDIITVR